MQEVWWKHCEVGQAGCTDGEHDGSVVLKR